jgi:hypothetical protein
MKKQRRGYLVLFFLQFHIISPASSQYVHPPASPSTALLQKGQAKKQLMTATTNNSLRPSFPRED